MSMRAILVLIAVTLAVIVAVSPMAGCNSKAGQVAVDTGVIYAHINAVARDEARFNAAVDSVIALSHSGTLLDDERRALAEGVAVAQWVYDETRVMLGDSTAGERLVAVGRLHGLLEAAKPAYTAARDVLTHRADALGLAPQDRARLRGLDAQIAQINRKLEQVFVGESGIDYTSAVATGLQAAGVLVDVIGALR